MKNRNTRNLLILVIVALAALVGGLSVHTDFVYKTDTHGKVTKTVSLTSTPAAHALVVAGADSVKKAPSVTKEAVSAVTHTVVIHAHHAAAKVESSVATITRDVGVVVFNGVHVATVDTAKVDSAKEAPVAQTKTEDTAKVAEAIKDTAQVEPVKGGSELPTLAIAPDTNRDSIDKPVSQFAKYERVMFQGVIAAPSMDTVDMTTDAHDRAADAAMQAIRAQARTEKAGQQ